MAATRNSDESQSGDDPQEIADALRAVPREELIGLTRRLGALGLNERAVCSCFGVHCVAHAQFCADGRAVPRPVPPAALLPWLFVARRAVPLEAARRRLGDDLDRLVALALIERCGDVVMARATLLPVREALVCCDPIGALVSTASNSKLRLRGSGTLPDDSSFHLIGSLPRRRVKNWLDVGTGNAVAPLALRGLARRIAATDVDARSLVLARAGAALSGAWQLDLRCADLLEGAEEGAPWSLITFNAPIPPPGSSLIPRFWKRVRDLVDAGGEVIAHTLQTAEDYPACLDLPGRTVAARYTPEGASPAFGVTVWHPGEPPASRLVCVPLTPERPHIDRALLGLQT